MLAQRQRWLLLANLRFKRDSIGQPQLDAAIHLVLLLRES